ncbi:MAG: beta-galactosidase [Planctomycetes bacterium]|nr:beta-galactosidase [Planctomycetota bacterium]
MKFLSAALALLLSLCTPPASAAPAGHRFEIGAQDFLYDGAPIVIRSGEMHFARIPREYWLQRLRMVRAMGCNTVCAYLFWNQLEPQQGQFDFTGQNDVAEYVRLAQQAGLHVILRPGPYACAEWEFGGFPWWLLQKDEIKLRTRDPQYLLAVRAYLAAVGRELAPLQVTHGGPILMVQVENEYGSYGKDKDYIGSVRDALVTAGFDVPLFTCDGPSQLPNDTRPEIFSVVNFGGDPQSAFDALRKVRPEGPLMCGEYYPGWFDSWGSAHHTGSTEGVLKDLGWMLEKKASFSIYMVHGGTSFGLSAGANAPPFRPQTTSYDYDAPIDEAGRPTSKFYALRLLFQRYLAPGETLPEIPPPYGVTRTSEISLDEFAPLFEELGAMRVSERPLAFEAMNQPQGLALYRTSLAAGPAGKLLLENLHDLCWVYLDGRLVGTLDRRFEQKELDLPERKNDARLDLLVEAMGRVNYGRELHDRKGILGTVSIGNREITGFEIFSLPLDSAEIASLRFHRGTSRGGPAFFRGHFEMKDIADTFLDCRKLSKGAVWVNGHALGRYWHIGPQQTLYLPGCWLRKGQNEIVVLDVDGGAKSLTLRGLDRPILDQLGDDVARPTAHRKAGQKLVLDGLTPVAKGSFTPALDWHSATFAPTQTRYVALQTLNGLVAEPWTTVAELAFTGADGAELPLAGMSVVYADCEETEGENGNASNAIDGDKATFWHTQWQGASPAYPHVLVIDLGAERTLTGFKYLPRQDAPHGRVKDFQLFTSLTPFPGQ